MQYRVCPHGIPYLRNITHADVFSGTGTTDTPPSLLVVVSGTVAHGPMDVNAKSINNIPRTFSQTFLMIPEVPGAVGQAAEPKYFVSADTMRFVG